MELDEASLKSLSRGTSLVEGLEADSLALIQMVEDAETRFGVSLDDDERLQDIRNIGDICDWINELRPVDQVSD